MIIPIDKLPIITSPEHFFNAENVVWIEILDLKNINPTALIRLIMHDKCIQAGGAWYYAQLFVDRPDIIAKKIMDGLDIPIVGKTQSLFSSFDDVVKNAILQEKIFDFSLYYKNPEAHVQFDQHFLIEKYLKKEWNLLMNN